MQRKNQKVDQSSIPFFMDNNLFAALGRYLPLADIAALAQTCQRGNELKRIVWFDVSTLENPVAVLKALSPCTRRQVAQFFRQYRNRLEPSIAKSILDKDNHAAYALHMLMCRVVKENVDKERAKKAVGYLIAEKRPQHLIHAVQFVYDVLYKNHKKFELVLTQKNFYINLRGARFGKENFNGSDLSFADMRDADLTDSRLNKCVLRGVEFQNAKLSYTRLENSDMTGANLTGAQIDIEEDVLCEFSSLNDVKFFIKDKKSDSALNKNIELMNFYHQMKIANPYVVMVMARDCIRNAARSHTVERDKAMQTTALQHPLFAAHYDFVRNYIYTCHHGDTTMLVDEVLKELEQEPQPQQSRDTFKQ